MKPPEFVATGALGCWKPVNDGTAGCAGVTMGVVAEKLNPPLAGTFDVFIRLIELFRATELVELLSVPANLKPPIDGLTTFVVFPKLKPLPVCNVGMIGKAVVFEFPKILDPITPIGCA